MKLLRKIILLLLLVSMIFNVVACVGKDPAQNEGNGDEINNSVPNEGNGDENNEPTMLEYTVTLLSPLGKPISGVTVLLHEDGGADYNVSSLPVVTDADGKAKFTLDSSKSYSVGLMGYSKLYLAKSGATRAERYVLDSTDVTVVLDVDDTYIPAMYNLGDTMPNFTLTDIDGNSYELYELLKVKDAVVLNFWFYGCGPCLAEFPALNTAYNSYKNDLEVLAINDNPEESLYHVQNYEKNKGLTLDMPLFRAEYGSKISMSRIDTIGYPTTLVIDRYGTISFIHAGAVTSVATWNKLFAFFTAEDYVPTVITSFDQLG